MYKLVYSYSGRSHQYHISGICQHLTSAAGWCIFQSICPKEVRSLEDCVGVSNIRTVSHIPARCSEREELLSACLEGQSQAADDRTAACPSKKKKQSQVQHPHKHLNSLGEAHEGPTCLRFLMCFEEWRIWEALCITHCQLNYILDALICSQVLVVT